VSPSTSRGRQSHSRSSNRRPGGSAKGVRRPQPTARVRAIPEGERTGPRFTGRAIVLLSVVVLLVGSYTSALHAWWDQRSEITAERAEIVERREAIRELENTKRRYDDPAFIQQQARERFGWVMPGEVGYRVIGVDGKIQGELSAPTDLPEPTVTRWYNVLWGSVEAAGREPGATPVTDPDKVLKDTDE
jgi:cell division protein FtsB